MKQIILEKIKPSGFSKLSISLFGYVKPNETNHKNKIYASQERAISSFYNTKDYKVKKFLKYPSNLLPNTFFDKLKSQNEEI
jgi:hypothetical protein